MGAGATASGPIWIGAMTPRIASDARPRRCRRSSLFFLLLLCAGCSVLQAPYHLVRGTVTGTVWVVKTTYHVTAGTVKIVYRIGEFTYEVVSAPVEWALTHDGMDSIDGLDPKEAIRQGRVKASPYVVHGKTYVPMTVEAAQRYREEGTASWYGYESGRMTANGEAFDPKGLSAAHKYLPLPTFVKVTNLANGRSVIVRVNDRGPFASADRIIDLSMGAAQRLGFHEQGLARVRVEAVELRAE
jgi:rare lipoprotein A